MKKQLETRINELKTEFESGQKMLAELDNKRADLNQTLLRISGAIQVLKEEIAKIEEPQVNEKGFSKEPNVQPFSANAEAT